MVGIRIERHGSCLTDVLIKNNVPFPDSCWNHFDNISVKTLRNLRKIPYWHLKWFQYSGQILTFKQQVKNLRLWMECLTSLGLHTWENIMGSSSSWVSRNLIGCNSLWELGNVVVVTAVVNCCFNSTEKIAFVVSNHVVMLLCSYFIGSAFCSVLPWHDMFPLMSAWVLKSWYSSDGALNHFWNVVIVMKYS